MDKILSEAAKKIIEIIAPLKTDMPDESWSKAIADIQLSCDKLAEPETVVYKHANRKLDPTDYDYGYEYVYDFKKHVKELLDGELIIIKFQGMIGFHVFRSLRDFDVFMYTSYIESDDMDVRRWIFGKVEYYTVYQVVPTETTQKVVLACDAKCKIEDIKKEIMACFGQIRLKINFDEKHKIYEIVLDEFREKLTPEAHNKLMSFCASGDKLLKTEYLKPLTEHVDVSGIKYTLPMLRTKLGEDFPQGPNGANEATKALLTCHKNTKIYNTYITYNIGPIINNISNNTINGNNNTITSATNPNAKICVAGTSAEDLESKPTTETYKNHVKLRKDSGLEPLTSHSFYREVEKQGYERIRKRTNNKQI